MARRIRAVIHRRLYARAACWLALIACQAVLVTTLLWPALRASAYSLPTSPFRTSITVPLFNSWTIWWNADRLKHGLNNYWDAPIFFPERGAFAFSDPQPATLMVAPCVWVTRSPLVAYHVYLWLSLALNGLAAAFCCRSLRFGWTLTLAASVAVVLLPIVWDNIDVLQLVPLWGMVLSIAAMLNFHRQPTLVRAIWIALSLTSVFLTSVHHGVFFLASVTPACWWLWPAPPQRLRFAAYSTGAAVLFGLLIAPLIFPIARVHTQHDFKRSREAQRELSATARQWCTVPERALIGGSHVAYPSRALNPGWLRCALALVAVLGIGAAGTRRREVCFVATLFVVSCLLSFGMNLAVGSWKVWPLIGQVLPPLDHARSLFRFAYIAQLALILLAAIGANTSMRLYRRWLREGKRRKYRPLSNLFNKLALLVGNIVLVSILVGELLPPQLRLIGVPDTRKERPWVSYLMNESSCAPVLCLPFVESLSEVGLESTARWMLLATTHHRPLVNGYSGFFPASWYENVRRFQSGQLPEETMAKSLLDSGVSTIVLDTKTSTAASAVGDRLILGAVQLRRVFVDESGIEVWRISATVTSPQVSSDPSRCVCK